MPPICMSTIRVSTISAGLLACNAVDFFHLKFVPEHVQDLHPKFKMSFELHPCIEQLHQERRVVLLHLRQGDAQRRPVRVVGDGGGCVAGTGRGALAAVGGV